MATVWTRFLLFNLSLISGLALGALPAGRPGRYAQSAFAARGGHGTTMSASAAGKVSIIVEVEIDPARLDDFLKVIEEDAIGSRERENGGCLRFDVHRDREKANVFRFYELYRDSAAVDFHKATPHFALWREFKASGGVLSQTSSVNDALFLP